MADLEAEYPGVFKGSVMEQATDNNIERAQSAAGELLPSVIIVRF